jgi:hypothetical protein
MSSNFFKLMMLEGDLDATGCKREPLAQSLLTGTHRFHSSRLVRPVANPQDPFAQNNTGQSSLSRPPLLLQPLQKIRPIRGTCTYIGQLQAEAANPANRAAQAEQNDRYAQLFKPTFEAFLLSTVTKPLAQCIEKVF